MDRSYRRLAADIILLAYRDILPRTEFEEYRNLEVFATSRESQDFAKKKLEHHRSAIRFFNNLEQTIWCGVLNISAARLKRAALQKAK